MSTILVKPHLGKSVISRTYHLLSTDLKSSDVFIFLILEV